MTTEVLVVNIHGKPVDVKVVPLDNEGKAVENNIPAMRLYSRQNQYFCVHAHQELMIKEVNE